MCDENENCDERLVPEGSPNDIVFQEHIGRYVFASQFVKDKIALDIATGAGYGSSYLCEQGAACVVGADNSFDAIDYANSRYRQECLHFVLADATRMPFKDCSFEFLVSFETIEHVEQYEMFLSECSRVLSDDGLFMCSTPNKKALNPRNPYHVKEFYPAEFFGLAKNYFSEVHCFGQENMPVPRLNVDKLLKDINEPLKVIVRSILGENFQKKLWIKLRLRYRKLNLLRKNKSQEKKAESQRFISAAGFSGVLHDDFEVTTFKDNRLVTPAFLLVLCKKPKKQKAIN